MKGLQELTNGHGKNSDPVFRKNSDVWRMSGGESFLPRLYVFIE